MDVEAAYRHYLSVTGEPQAASNLVLADAYALKHPPVEPLMDTKQAAAYLNVSETMVKSLCVQGKVRSIKIGKLHRIKREWLNDFASPPTRKQSRHY